MKLPNLTTVAAALVALMVAAPGIAMAADPMGVDDGTQLTLWTRAATQARVDQLVQAYNASHKNQVTATYVVTDDYTTKVGAAAAANGLPDLFSADVVFMPSQHDIHQDHRTIADEGLRAFKRTTILGYEIPWNNFDFSYQAYFALEKAHVERKVAALEKYASQQHRRYANAEYVWNVARTHGINVNREYAEVFQVYRVVA